MSVEQVEDEEDSDLPMKEPGPPAEMEDEEAAWERALRTMPAAPELMPVTAPSPSFLNHEPPFNEETPDPLSGQSFATPEVSEEDRAERNRRLALERLAARTSSQGGQLSQTKATPRTPSVLKNALKSALPLHTLSKLPENDETRQSLLDRPKPIYFSNTRYLCVVVLSVDRSNGAVTGLNRLTVRQKCIGHVPSHFSSGSQSYTSKRKPTWKCDRIDKIVDLSFIGAWREPLRTSNFENLRYFSSNCPRGNPSVYRKSGHIKPERADPNQPIQLLFGLDNHTYEEADLTQSAETSHPTASTKEKQVKNYLKGDESDGASEVEFEVPSHENILAITSNITLLEQDQFIRDLMDQINSLYESAQWMYDEAERHFNLAEKLVEKADKVADRAEASRRHLSEWMQRYGLGWDVVDTEDVVAENVVETNDLDDQL
ncbi:hypothetical protein CLF_106849 [Clonorchis sinensis]|uniref:Uncharacterized protein n=1 Tax=Clonorchis sinensis TaxID=79923 RepID=G7YFV0_CLOSI|nr:hypothetical protein CLF_106849 [Clonorchis sinensis]